jgi:DNA repair exonuclease SbcCD ATPase subunit
MRLGDVTLPLDAQGLVLLLGDNRDTPKASSNGAGKSALLDALCWALWGKTVRGHTADAVVNRAVGKDCEASVEWVDGPIHYRVTRYRKHTNVPKPNDVILEVNGEPEDGAGMAATQNRINDILGLNFRTFQAMMPGAGLKAAEMTDSSIKELLERLLQMDIISKAQDIAKDKLKKVNLEIDTKEKNILYIDKEIANCESLLEKYKEGLKNFEEDRDKAIREIQTEVANILKKRPKLTAVLEEASKATKTLQETQERLYLESNIRSSLQSQLKALETQPYLSKLRLKKERIFLEIDSLNDEYNNYKNINYCNSCHQTISEQHKIKQLATLKNLKEQKLGEGATIDQMLSGALETYEDTKYKLKVKHSRVMGKMRAYELQIQELQLLITEGKYVSTIVDDLNETEQKLSDKQWALQQKESPFQGLLGETVDKIQDLTDKAVVAKAEVSDLRGQAERLIFWVAGFSAQGLRSLMLRHITPILNTRAKYYSDLLTDGEMSIEFSTEKKLKNGKTKEEFNIQVFQEHGDSSYAGSSSGEKARADLAIAFALGDLAHLRANKRIPFRFLDEPFESIDDSGHESIVRLLNEQKDHYSTVFCITHKESFQQLFPKSIRIVKEDGISRLEQIDD